MTAEVPSRIAFATSLASARVGSAECTIDSSICVAVITGFPRSSAFWMIRFCTSGTSAGPISTPRSPRATITASVSASTSSRTSTASAFSILAITCACEPACSIRARRSRTSAGERTNESATKSTPVSSAHSRSTVSLRVSEGIGIGTPGRLTPLCEVIASAHEHGAASTALLDVVDPQANEPVVDQDVVPRLEHLADHGRSDRQLAVDGRLLRADGDVLSLREHDRIGEARRCAASAPGGRRSAQPGARPRPRSRGRARRARSARRASRARG